MSHIFISYSKKNKDYAQLFKSKLLAEGFNVWMDDAIEPSEDWWRTIRKAIKDCAAFSIIMTPDAENSHWVGLELLHAIEYDKALFPLLRAGDPNLMNSDAWSRIANIQYTDVRNGQLPLDGFYSKLAGSAPHTAPGTDVTPPQPATPTPPLSRIHAVAITDIIPPPFEWCTVTGGWVTLEDQGTERGMYRVDPFHLAKYPVTNGQYDIFVRQGYGESRWWNYSPNAEKWHIDHPQSEDTAFAGHDLPRTNVCWYDALAFCRWLSAKTQLTITLPTEQQWQRAAQGNDGRIYPWGNKFNNKLCNYQGNGVTPVTLYLKGISPFHVMDMSGNVWEWCLSEYGTDSTNAIGNNLCGLRGGSWRFNGTDGLSADFRDWDFPKIGNDDRGFRVALPATI